jgi:hypothetical protein
MRLKAERSTVHPVRFSLSEWAAVREAAVAAGVSFGRYVRVAALERVRSDANPADDTPTERLAA